MNNQVQEELKKIIWEKILKRYFTTWKDFAKIEFRRIHKNTQEFTRIHKISQEFTRTHEKSHKYTRIHKNSQEATGIHKNPQSLLLVFIVHKLRA